MIVSMIMVIMIVMIVCWNWSDCFCYSDLVVTEMRVGLIVTIGRVVGVVGSQCPSLTSIVNYRTLNAVRTHPTREPYLPDTGAPDVTVQNGEGQIRTLAKRSGKVESGCSDLLRRNSRSG